MGVKGKRAEQAELIPDRELKDLSDAARKYAAIRDERQDLTRREVETKSDLLALMKKHKRKEYDYDGIHVEIVLEKENVKVKIAKGEEIEDADEAA